MHIEIAPPRNSGACDGEGDASIQADYRTANILQNFFLILLRILSKITQSNE